ncbi:MAG: hypothetical protein WED07_01935 [Candidatus Freyarchaeum deiterrae]
MDSWLKQLRYNPLPLLISSENKALLFFVKRDLLSEKDNPVQDLWQLPDVTKIIGKQLDNGSWKYPSSGARVRSEQNYNQLETYRMLGQLVEKYGLTREHSAIKKAADFLFSFQTEEGDFRGIYGKQYTPNYTAGIMELLTKAGYNNDPHVDKGFKWLLSIRQNDGGWAIPLRTVGAKLDIIALDNDTIKPDSSKPFSHLVTGVVLRGFAAHEKYRKSKEAKAAGELLTSHLFKSDNYPDRGDPSYWIKFAFPFWFTDLLSALDSLSLLGFTKDIPQIGKALKWLIDSQKENGLWELNLLKNKSGTNLNLWIDLAICKMLKRFYE